MPLPIKLSDVCLSVCLTSVVYIWSAGGVCGRPAGWRVLADWAQLGRAGPVSLAQVCRCALPFHSGRGHIVAAACL